MTMTAEQLAQTIRPDLEMLCDSEELTAERRASLARIVEHLTPPNLLALLDELKAADALNKHLELAIRKAEGCSEALRRKTEAAEKRISELEARTVTVKLPDDGMDDCYDLWGAEHCRDNFDCGYNFSAVRHEEAIREACAAAGINLTVEG